MSSMKDCLSRASLALPLLLTATLLGLVPTKAKLQAPEVTLPDRPKAVRFAVIGDTGTGSTQQYEVGEQMARA